MVRSRWYILGFARTPAPLCCSAPAGGGGRSPFGRFLCWGGALQLEYGNRPIGAEAGQFFGVSRSPGSIAPGSSRSVGWRSSKRRLSGAGAMSPAQPVLVCGWRLVAPSASPLQACVFGRIPKAVVALCSVASRDRFRKARRRCTEKGERNPVKCLGSGGARVAGGGAERRECNYFFQRSSPGR